MLTKSTAFRMSQKKKDNNGTVIEKQAQENKNVIVLDEKKDENKEENIEQDESIVSNLNSNAKKEELRNGPTNTGIADEDIKPMEENKKESPKKKGDDRQKRNKTQKGSIKQKNDIKPITKVPKKQIVSVEKRIKKEERTETKEEEKNSEAKQESKEDKIEDGNEKDVGIAEASSTLIGEEENNESRKNRLSRICEKYKIHQKILRSTRYFVFSFFLEIAFILFILIPTEQPKCCVETTKDIPWTNNITRVVKNRTVVSHEQGVDQVPSCQKYTNPNEAFLHVCDNGTARQRLFIDISIVFGCLLISSFLFSCRLRYKIRKRHPIHESLLNFVVYIIFICVPLCSLPFQILDSSPVGIGCDLQLINCGCGYRETN